MYLHEALAQLHKIPLYKIPKYSLVLDGVRIDLRSIISGDAMSLDFHELISDAWQLQMENEEQNEQT